MAVLFSTVEMSSTCNCRRRNSSIMGRMRSLVILLNASSSSTSRMLFSLFW